MNDLPEEYIPTKLRVNEPGKRDHPVYIVGRRKSVVGFGWGSFEPHSEAYDELEKVLEYVPTGPYQHVVFCFNTDGTETPLYEWHMNKWVRIKEGKK